ncbi:MAG TPA: cytochrome c oxidase assembly protein, partial [Gemmatimonadales bacterium]|nr:cytochrome c oxidase assembly protein [Gemmatimonadales bacterium]
MIASRLTWWCSATGQPWSWTWRPYPGVWLFVALLGAWYAWAVRGTPRRELGWRPLWMLVSLVSVWAALDWPLGALGAGYLASFHTISYILLVIIAPPCLILGLPTDAVRRGLERPLAGPVLRFAARPVLALVIYSAIVLLTHVPDVVDGGMRTQVGAMVIDLGWMVAGLFLWWPAMGPSPDVVRMSRPLKMVYLFASTLPPIIPSAFLTFADYPLYSTYELAPRIFPILTAQQDQQLAGLI